jgi:hypothetical protein
MSTELVLVRVWCAACLDEKVLKPGLLGEVRVWRGRPWWVLRDNRRGQRAARGHEGEDRERWRALGRMANVARLDPDDMPPRLRGSCVRHGLGFVDTAPVTDAIQTALRSGPKRDLTVRLHQ